MKNNITIITTRNLSSKINVDTKKCVYIYFTTSVHFIGGYFFNRFHLKAIFFNNYNYILPNKTSIIVIIRMLKNIALITTKIIANFSLTKWAKTPNTNKTTLINISNNIKIILCSIIFILPPWQLPLKIHKTTNYLHYNVFT